MEQLWQFSLEPSAENFRKLSLKTRNQLGETFTAFEAAVILKYFDEPSWAEFITVDKKVAADRFLALHIEVISKLIAAPRLGLLNKAWGIFYATGNYKYLSIAFETAGNSRASGSVRTIATKLYEEAREFYSEHYASSQTNPCVSAFIQMENEIAESQERLKKYKEEGVLLSQGKLDRRADNIDELLGFIRKQEPEESEEPEEDEEFQEADQLFNRIANEVCTKIV
jgi:hypothetical protein